MGLVRIPLSEQEEAHVALILDLHKADMGQVQRLTQEADARQATRFGPLTRQHNIPDNTVVKVEARKDDQPAFLTYEAPDIPQAPQDTDVPSQSATGS